MDRRRFNTLPRRADDEWQGGVVRLPSWVERGPGGRPYRPWAGFWISRNTGFVHLKVEPAPDAHGWTLALETLLEFAAQRHLAGYRPGRLQVCDGDLGARLIEAIGDPELGLTVLSDLPAVRQALSTMAERLAGGPLPPDALDADGVTVDRMRAFARAADAFYRAAPWRYLLDEDLIHVEAPSMKHGLRHVTILGAAGQTFGLGFFDSAADHAEVQEQDDPTDFIGRSRWSVFHGPISELPHGDADLWENHALPAAGDQAYPIAIQFDPRGSLRRPDAATLSYLEGLLRALAGSDEDEIDRGRWTRDVTTYDGPVTYRLCIPPLLEPYDAPPKAGPAPLRGRRAMERVMVEWSGLSRRRNSPVSKRPTRPSTAASLGSRTRNRRPGRRRSRRRRRSLTAPFRPAAGAASSWRGRRWNQARTAPTPKAEHLCCIARRAALPVDAWDLQQPAAALSQFIAPRVDRRENPLGQRHSIPFTVKASAKNWARPQSVPPRAACRCTRGSRKTARPKEFWGMARRIEDKTAWKSFPCSAKIDGTTEAPAAGELSGARPSTWARCSQVVQRCAAEVETGRCERRARHPEIDLAPPARMSA